MTDESIPEPEKCPHCNGSGGFVQQWEEVVQGCCGNILPDGQCCGNAVTTTQEVADVIPCDLCEGFGTVEPSND